jgi:predicted  nucleic acid-binding Zn-ribbon protein
MCKAGKKIDVLEIIHGAYTTLQQLLLAQRKRTMTSHERALKALTDWACYSKIDVAIATTPAFVDMFAATIDAAVAEKAKTDRDDLEQRFINVARSQAEVHTADIERLARTNQQLDGVNKQRSEVQLQLIATEEQLRAALRDLSDERNKCASAQAALKEIQTAHTPVLEAPMNEVLDAATKTPPDETTAPVEWEGDPVGLCDHDVNHADKRHKCDGCYKKGETPAPTCSCDKPQINGDGVCGKCGCSTRHTAETTASRCSCLNCVRGQRCLHAPAPTRNTSTPEGHARVYDEVYRALTKATSDLTTANEEIARRQEKYESAAVYARRVEVAHAATTAKLGRAVAALRDAMTPANDSMPNSVRVMLAVNTILADAESAAAGEAWAAAAAIAEYITRNKVAMLFERVDGDYRPAGIGIHVTKLIEALAKVDARRGGGR